MADSFAETPAVRAENLRKDIAILQEVSNSLLCVWGHSIADAQVFAYSLGCSCSTSWGR